MASPAVEKLVTSALFNGAEIIEKSAKISITTGSVGGEKHIRSKPGEAPNNEFGDLVRGIEAARYGPLRARVTSNAPHATPLEFGTSKMAARPYMVPARNKNKKEVRALVSKALQVAVKRSTQK
jgi:HK97 gp10 family phage protein